MILSLCLGLYSIFATASNYRDLCSACHTHRCKAAAAVARKATDKNQHRLTLSEALSAHIACSLAHQRCISSHRMHQSACHQATMFSMCTWASPLSGVVFLIACGVSANTTVLFTNCSHAHGCVAALPCAVVMIQMLSKSRLK